MGVRRNRYDLYLGGAPAGCRLADPYARNLTLDQVVSTVASPIERWVREGQVDESFGSFYARTLHRKPHERTLSGAH